MRSKTISAIVSPQKTTFRVNFRQFMNKVAAGMLKGLRTHCNTREQNMRNNHTEGLLRGSAELSHLATQLQKRMGFLHWPCSGCHCNPQWLVLWRNLVTFAPRQPWAPLPSQWRTLSCSLAAPQWPAPQKTLAAFSMEEPAVMLLRTHSRAGVAAALPSRRSCC